MTLEEYLEKPFKTDGQGNDVLISDVWGFLTRKERREIQRLLKEGKEPDIVDYL